MKSLNPRMTGLVAAMALALLQTGYARAETPAVQQQNAGQGSAAIPLSESGSLTGKERLGRKWSDEQRLDNCNVPIDKRGSRPRPSDCAHVPTI
jgi:hypothetical protein